MKKLTLSIIVLAAITFASCKKEQVQPHIQPQSNPNQYNVSVKNNRLAFQSIDDYVKAVTNPTKEQRSAFLKTVNGFENYTSYSNKFQFRNGIQNPIQDEFLESILNSDLAIQIGENIFRVNAETKKVYVLPVANEDQYNDLVNENIVNQNIKVFSTNDEVLDLIESKSSGTANRGIICRESGIGGRDVSTGVLQIDNQGVFNMEGQLHFNRFGIYYNLFAELQTAQNNSGAIELTMDLDPIYYHVRCDETADYNVYGHGTGNYFFYKKYQSYQGAKNLNKLFLRARFHGNVGTVTRTSDWIEIRVNA